MWQDQQREEEKNRPMNEKTLKGTVTQHRRKHLVSQHMERLARFERKTDPELALVPVDNMGNVDNFNKMTIGEHQNLLDTDLHVTNTEIVNNIIINKLHLSFTHFQNQCTL